jgi:hypothetical protein
MKMDFGADMPNISLCIHYKAWSKDKPKKARKRGGQGNIP